MLVLSRKVGETIVIGGQVTVTVRSVRSKYVSLGITAPDNVSVDRSEVHLRKNVEGASRGEGESPECGEVGADLLTAIQRLVSDAQACGGPEIEFCHDFQDYVANPLPLDLESAVFRIVKEFVAIACRHSTSKRVLIGLNREDDSLLIEAQDWGIGSDPARIRSKLRWLAGIRQRSELLGGTVTIQSRPREGTCITVELPLVAAAKERSLETGRNTRAGARFSH